MRGKQILSVDSEAGGYEEFIVVGGVSTSTGMSPP